ncbi:MAG: family 78 glycoside hydrolase catalytic domain [Clostridia bacterium]|nr:family 78 glycoside hydrolase catalytic domain [Clostridia bacterium]
MNNPVSAPAVTNRDIAFSGRARWIRGDNVDPYARTYLRRTFELAQKPHEALLLIMAANAAEVQINGRAAAMHQVRSYIFDTIYEIYDVTAWLQAGRNEVLVRNIHSDSPARNGVALEVLSDGVSVCVSDGAWEYAPDTSLDGPVNYHISGGGEEIVRGDACMESVVWTPVQVVGEALLQPPYTSFRQSRIPAQTHDVRFPVRVSAVMHAAEPTGFAGLLGPAGTAVAWTHLTVARDTQIRLSGEDGLRRWALDGRSCPMNRRVDIPAGTHLVGLLFAGAPGFCFYSDEPMHFSGPAGGELPLTVYCMNTPPVRYPWNEYRGPSEADARMEQLLNAATYDALPENVRADVQPMDFGRKDTVREQIRRRVYTVPQNGFAETGIRRDPNITDCDRCLNITDVRALLSPDGEVTVNEDGACILLDFGDEKVGRLAFEAEAVAGTVLDFHCFEMINDAGIFYMPERNTLRYTCRNGAQEYIAARRRGFRYVMVTVTHTAGPVCLKNIRVIEHRCPTESGDFRCSDERLNRIYEMSLRTAEVCMLETYVDCPGYEQNPWTGDARCTAGVNLYDFGAYDFDRQYLKLIAQSVEEGVCRVYRPNNPRYRAGMYLPCACHPTYPEGCIPMWSFMWLMQVWDHYECTGDRAALEEVFYAVKETLRRCEQMTDGRGLFDMQGAWNLIEWANNDLDYYGEVTANNILLAQCFGCAADMAEVLGEPALAAHYRAQRSAYRTAVNQYCWSEADRAYVDTVRDAYGYARSMQYLTERHAQALEQYEARSRAGKPAKKPAPLHLPTYEQYLSRKRISVQTNTLALLYDAAPPERQADALRFLLDNVTDGVYVSGTPANRTTGAPSEEEAPGGYVRIGSPFFMYFALQTLYKYGHDRLALETQRRAWGEFLDSGLTTCLETFKKGETWTRSIAHAWSASPAQFMVQEVLGIRPVKPGFAEFTVEPKTDGLDFASGSVPTPSGRIEVQWHKNADGTLNLTCRAPKGCKRV